MKENLAKLCPIVIWKAELTSDGLGYLAEEIAKPSVEGIAWFFLAPYSRI